MGERGTDEIMTVWGAVKVLLTWQIVAIRAEAERAKNTQKDKFQDQVVYQENLHHFKNNTVIPIAIYIMPLEPHTNRYSVHVNVSQTFFYLVCRLIEKKIHQICYYNH